MNVVDVDHVVVYVGVVVVVVDVKDVVLEIVVV